MFASCSVISVLPTLPQSSLSTQSSHSCLPCLSITPHWSYHLPNCYTCANIVTVLVFHGQSLPQVLEPWSTQMCQPLHSFYLGKHLSSWPPSGVLRLPYHLCFDPNHLYMSHLHPYEMFSVSQTVSRSKKLRSTELVLISYLLMIRAAPPWGQNVCMWSPHMKKLDHSCTFYHNISSLPPVLVTCWHSSIIRK